MINEIILSEDLVIFLEDRNLSKQYKKAKNYLINGLYKQVQFKLREPKKEKIYYFRINKQYRAFCKLDGNILKVFDINDHQN